MTLLLTLAIFPLVGAAAARLLRLPVPASRAARWSFLFLVGLGMEGALLYALGVCGVPLGALTFAAIPVVSLLFVWRRATHEPARADWLPALVFAQLTRLVGPAKVAATARQLGITRHLNPYFAIGLTRESQNEVVRGGKVRISGEVRDGAGEPVPDAVGEESEAAGDQQRLGTDLTETGEHALGPGRKRKLARGEQDQHGDLHVMQDLVSEDDKRSARLQDGKGEFAIITGALHGPV